MTERTFEQIIYPFVNYSDVILQSFLALIRLFAQRTVVGDSFAFSFGAVMNLLVISEILQLLECHPADITGDDQTTLVYPHVCLVLVGLGKLLATQIAGVFVPGLTLMDDGHVILQALFVAV